MRILLPFDGSPASMHAARHAAQQLKASAAKVLLLNVQPLYIDAEMVHAGSALVNFHRHEGEDVLEQAVDILAANDIDYEARVGFGPIAEVIAHTAEQMDCEAIVMGTRVRHPLIELFTRSVPSLVLRRTEIPVVLVPHASARRAPRSRAAEAPSIAA